MKRKSLGEEEKHNNLINLTYLGVTVLAFGNNRATQNAGYLGVMLTLPGTVLRRYFGHFGTKKTDLIWRSAGSRRGLEERREKRKRWKIAPVAL